MLTEVHRGRLELMLLFSFWTYLFLCHFQICDFLFFSLTVLNKHKLHISIATNMVSKALQQNSLMNRLTKFQVSEIFIFLKLQCLKDRIIYIIHLFFWFEYD
jgi:hypothetical protein